MHSFLKGFRFAWNGMVHLLRTERNFRVEVAIFLLVVLLGVYLRMSNTDWLAILLISAVVLSLEAVNTALEKMCDLHSTAIDPRIKVIKDVAAGAVLIASIFSIAIGLLVFLKYL